MAEDEKRSRPPPSIPSLLAGRSSTPDERQSSRILATLEGRVPDAEVKHLPPKTRSKTPLVVLLLLFLGAVGAGLWAVYDTAQLPVVVARADADASSGLSTSGAAAPGTSPAGATTPNAALPTASLNQPAAGQAPARANAEAPPSNAATIIEDHPLAQLTQPEAQADLREPANPLAALAVAAAAPNKPAAAASAKAPGPAPQRTERARDGTVAAATAAAPQATTAKGAPKAAAAPARGKAAPRSDSDAALLAALMSYGLPPASPPGTKVYKTDGIFVRELPGSSLSTRLGECRKLGFLESEQCRLRVCAGHWGTAPECPNAQAHTEP